jgi:hypothetical protein
MRIVEVRSDRVDFPKTLGAMREWLDQNGRPLVRFETEADGDTILIKVRFDADDLAERFRQSLGGSYEGVPPPVNTEAAKLGANPSD